MMKSVPFLILNFNQKKGISPKLFELESWNFGSWLFIPPATDTTNFVYILAAVFFSLLCLADEYKWTHARLSTVRLGRNRKFKILCTSGQTFPNSDKDITSFTALDWAWTCMHIRALTRRSRRFFASHN